LVNNNSKEFSIDKTITTNLKTTKVITKLAKYHKADKKIYGSITIENNSGYTVEYDYSQILKIDDKKSKVKFSNKKNSISFKLKPHKSIVFPTTWSIKIDSLKNVRYRIITDMNMSSI
jgi:hypothetical protein